MRVHLVNPSEMAFGLGVITPRWLYVLAAATPKRFQDPLITDETLHSLDLESVAPGDVVGIGIHTANACRGYEIGRKARERGATVIFGGIHATLYPEEALELGGAHAVVKNDGDDAWGVALTDLERGELKRIYEGGRVPGDRFLAARWDLLPPGSYMWGSVQTVRGCPKHCSFCSVWRTDGQAPRQRSADVVIEEVVQLRRQGYRFIALADDNFYPASFEDIVLAEKQGNTARVAELKHMRAERFDLMERLAQLPSDMTFFTQITLEAAEDPSFLAAMSKAHIRGGLVGVESVTEEGLKAVFKSFNPTGDNLVQRMKTFRQHNVHVLGSFIFGLPSDRADTFDATAAFAKESDITFAQFVTMTPYPGTVDFQRWEKEKTAQGGIAEVEGVPLNRYWLIPNDRRPKLYTDHPTMSMDEIRVRTQGVWDSFYSMPEIWKRSRCVKSLRGRLAFIFVSKLYRQMYANTGIATDSARKRSSNRWARWLAKPCLKLFRGKPMPDLQVPARGQLKEPEYETSIQ